MHNHTEGKERNSWNILEAKHIQPQENECCSAQASRNTVTYEAVGIVTDSHSGERRTGTKQAAKWGADEAVRWNIGIDNVRHRITFILC